MWYWYTHKSYHHKSLLNTRKQAERGWGNDGFTEKSFLPGSKLDTPAHLENRKFCSPWVLHSEHLKRSTNCVTVYQLMLTHTILFCSDVYFSILMRKLDLLGYFYYDGGRAGTLALYLSGVSMHFLHVFGHWYLIFYPFLTHVTTCDVICYKNKLRLCPTTTQASHTWTNWLDSSHKDSCKRLT